MITRYDIVYMKMASEWGQLSNARRKKVGALLVKNNTIIADGYNGTPSGFENECENPLFDASSLTFITLDILVKDANDAVDPNWRNDLIYFSIKTNQNNKVEVKIDSGGVATHYRLIAINEKPNKFNIR